MDTRLFSEFIERKRFEDNVAGMAVAVTDRRSTVFAQGFGVESIERPALKVEPCVVVFRFGARVRCGIFAEYQ